MQSTHPRYRLPVLTVPRVVEIRDILKEEGKNRTEDECALLHKLLRANKFFVELSHEVREELTRLMGVTTLNANTVLFREGDTSNAFFLLLHGALAIYQHNPPPLSPQERRDSLNEAVAAAEIYALPPSSPSQPALVHALTAPQEVLALPEETSSPHKGGRVSHMMSILDADSPQSQKAAAKKSKTSPIFLTTGTAVKFHMDEVEDEESDDELPPEEEENLGELIATLTPGDTLGELGLVKDTERLVSVKTVLGEGAGEEVRRRFGGERLGVPSKAEQRFDKRQTVVCWIQKEDFLEAFRRAAYKQIEQKMTFLYRWLPDEQVLDEKTTEKLAASFFKPISVPRGHVLLQAGSLQSANEGQRRIYFVYKGECVLRSWGRPMQPVIKKRDLESPRELSCGTLACGHMCGFSSTLLGVVEPFTVVAASSTVDLLAITSHDILSRLPKEVQNGLKRKAETLLRAYLRRQLHNKVAAARLRQLQKMQQQATAPSLFDSPFLKYKQRGFYSKASAARLQQLHQLATGWTPPEIVLEAAPPPSRPSTTAGVSGPPIAGTDTPGPSLSSCPSELLTIDSVSPPAPFRSASYLRQVSPIPRGATPMPHSPSTPALSVPSRRPMTTPAHDVMANDKLDYALRMSYKPPSRQMVRQQKRRVGEGDGSMGKGTPSVIEGVETLGREAVKGWMTPVALLGERRPVIVYATRRNG